MFPYLAALHHPALQQAPSIRSPYRSCSLVLQRVTWAQPCAAGHAFAIWFKRPLSVFSDLVPQPWPQFISKASCSDFAISPSRSGTICANVFLPVTDESWFPGSGWSPSIFFCLALAVCLLSPGSSKWAAPSSLLFPVALLHPSY